MNSCMRIGVPLTALLALSAAAAAPAFAQTYPGYQGYQYQYVRPFVYGGASITEGDTSNDFDNGWTLGGGLNFPTIPGTPLNLRVDVNYARSEATSAFINANEAATGTAIDRGSLQTVTGFFDAVLQAPVSPWVRLYALGGVGIGYRRIELTNNGFFCDSFFCGGGFGRSLVASGDSTHFAWNAGAGVDFPLPNGQSWFIEARYERIQSLGPTELVPIRFGFRF